MHVPVGQAFSFAVFYAITIMMEFQPREKYTVLYRLKDDLLSENGFHRTLLDSC